jgi:ribosomal-protein-alanine N-acetyltransferase
MAAIHRAAFPQEPWDAPSFTTLLGQPGVFGLLDPRGGIVLLRAVADEAEILTIGVTAPRQGIGKALMREAITRVLRQGVAVIHLEVAANNSAARGLYESLGFVPAGLRKTYYANGEDAILLSLSL